MGNPRYSLVVGVVLITTINYSAYIDIENVKTQVSMRGLDTHSHTHAQVDL